MYTNIKKVIQREILLGFWKIHILHHAGQGPVVGQWMIQELRRHGYEISPGTMYPLLQRLEAHGWLKCKNAFKGGAKSKKEYLLTKNGRKTLDFLKNQISELYREVILEEQEKELQAP